MTKLCHYHAEGGRYDMPCSPSLTGGSIVHDCPDGKRRPLRKLTTGFTDVPMCAQKELYVECACGYSTDPIKMEVIGNIHENPELLAAELADE